MEKLIGRLKKSGDFELPGELYEYITAYSESKVIDDTHIVDENILLDENGEASELINELFGIENDWAEVDQVGFDEYGNIYAKEFVENDANTPTLQISDKMVIKGVFKENIDLR